MALNYLLFRKEMRCGSLVWPRDSTGKTVSTAAVPSLLSLYHLGPRDTKGSEQMAQRLRTEQNLPYYHVSVKRAKAVRQPGQGVWQGSDPLGLSRRFVSKKRALDLLVAKIS